MRASPFAVLLLATLAFPALAQRAAAPPPEALPPPAIDAPGVTPPVDAAPLLDDRADPSAAPERAPLAPQDAPARATDVDASAPTVIVRTQANGDVVEEYRNNGRLTMVKITPRRGPAYYLIDSNGDGRLDRDDSDGAPVAPVYYKLYEWD